MVFIKTLSPGWPEGGEGCSVVSNGIEDRSRGRTSSQDLREAAAQTTRWSPGQRRSGAAPPACPDPPGVHRGPGPPPSLILEGHFHKESGRRELVSILGQEVDVAVSWQTSGREGAHRESSGHSGKMLPDVPDPAPSDPASQAPHPPPR